MDTRILPPRRRVWLLALFALGLAGCSAEQDPNRLPVHPASGRLSIQGKTPEGALVVLHPKTATPGVGEIRPRAHVKPDGTFELSSYETSDGAPAGEYAVTVDWRPIVKYRNGDAGPGPSLVPRRWSRPETSPLTVRIAEGKNELAPIVVR